MTFVPYVQRIETKSVEVPNSNTLLNLYIGTNQFTVLF